MDFDVLRCFEHDLTILKNVCLSACVFPKFCGHCISRANARNVTKFYILLYLDKNWGWLDIGGYRLIGGAPMLHFRRTFRYLKYLISLGLLQGNKPNSDLLEKKVWVKFLGTSNSRERCCCIFSSNVGTFLILYICRSFALSHLLHQNILVICGCISTGRGRCYTATHFPRI